MTSRWRTTGALFALLVLTAAFYWKLTISHEWTFLEGPDLANVVRPWLDFEAREFHAGRFPLWDPYEWAGHTLIGQVQPGITNPLNWILFAMPLRDGHIPVTTLHWYWVLIHWLGAVFWLYAVPRFAGRIRGLLTGRLHLRARRIRGPHRLAADPDVLDLGTAGAAVLCAGCTRL